MENDLLCIRTEIFTRFSGFFFPYNVSAATARQSHDQLANPIIVPLLKVAYFLPC